MSGAKAFDLMLFWPSGIILTGIFLHDKNSATIEQGHSRKFAFALLNRLP